MWKSIPPWAMVAILAVPSFGSVLLQAKGASESLQTIASVLFMGAIVLVIYLIRLRKREAPTATRAKKLLLILVLWLVAVFILALVWANGQALLRMVYG